MSEYVYVVWCYIGFLVFEDIGEMVIFFVFLQLVISLCFEYEIFMKCSVVWDKQFFFQRVWEEKLQGEKFQESVIRKLIKDYM